MNIALIMAGGLGQTLLQDIPKQFLNVYDKPIIIYALEVFQKHAEIDGIVISCLDGWEEMCKEDDIVVIHDAIRPMVTEDIISDCIRVCREYRCGVAAVRCQEPVVRSMDGLKGIESFERFEMMKIQTPQAYPYGQLLNLYKEAEEKGIRGVIHANTILTRLGKQIYFSKGSDKNLKILSLDDLDIFKALYATEREDWIKYKN